MSKLTYDYDDAIFYGKKPYKKTIHLDMNILDETINLYTVGEIVERIGIDKVQDYIRTKKLQKITKKK